MTPPSGMWDAVCVKCRKRYGGRYGQDTDCPWCDEPNPGADEDLKKIERIARLIKIHPKDATAEELREQRELSGLGLVQAAHMLDIRPSQLALMEQGDMRPDETLAAKMSDAYGCGFPAK